MRKEVQMRLNVVEMLFHKGKCSERIVRDEDPPIYMNGSLNLKSAIKNFTK